jgi:hypothetical protein
LIEKISGYIEDIVYKNNNLEDKELEKNIQKEIELFQKLKASFLDKDRVGMLISFFSEYQDKLMNINDEQKEIFYYSMKILLNLLRIPDEKANINSSNIIRTKMQEELIYKYSNEAVFDLLLYITQNFKEKKYIELILEFNYFILREDTIQNIINANEFKISHDSNEEKTSIKINDLLKNEKKKNNLPVRHSRFGGLYTIKLNEETNLLTNSIDKKNLDEKNIKKRFDKR